MTLNRTSPPLERGISFLLAHQGRDGLWQDFRTLAGESADWVTGYVGLNLLRAGAARTALGRAAESLVYRQKADGGWGYNAEVPTDADSTAYVLLFLAGMSVEPQCLRRAAKCLQSHQNATCGGIVTYREPGPIREYMWLPPDFSIDGWCHPHIEVTAAAGRALAAMGSGSHASASRAWEFIAARRTRIGYWQSYWWALPHYPTFQCLALARAIPEVRHDAEIAESVARWLCATQLSDGGWGPTPDDPSSPFATALGISTLAMISADAGAVRRGVNALVKLQESDGGWAAAPSLQIPPPNIAEPSQQERWRIGQLGTGVVIADQHRLYTTASCVGALAAAGTFDDSSLS